MPILLLFGVGIFLLVHQGSTALALAMPSKWGEWSVTKPHVENVPTTEDVIASRPNHTLPLSEAVFIPNSDLNTTKACGGNTHEIPAGGFSNVHITLQTC